MRTKILYVLDWIIIISAVMLSIGSILFFLTIRAFIQILPYILVIGFFVYLIVKVGVC